MNVSWLLKDVTLVLKDVTFSCKRNMGATTFNITTFSHNGAQHNYNDNEHIGIVMLCWVLLCWMSLRWVLWRQDMTISLLVHQQNQLFFRQSFSPRIISFSQSSKAYSDSSCSLLNASLTWSDADSDANHTNMSLLKDLILRND